MTSLMQRANSYVALEPKPDTLLYLLSVPPLIIASVSTHVWASDPALVVKYAVANFLSFLCIFPVFALAKRRVRPIRGNYLLPIALFGLLLGVVKGVTTALFVIGIGAESELLDALVRRSATPGIGIWFALTLAFSKAVLADIEQTQQVLLAEARRRVQPTLVPEVERFLASAKKLAKSTPESSTQMVALILDLVNQGVRPLSHELMERRGLNAVNLWGLLSLGTRAKFHPLIGASVFAVSLSSPLAVSSLETILLGLAISFAMALALLTLGNFFKKKLPQRTAPQLMVLVTTSLVTGSSVLITLGSLGIINTPVLAIGILSASWWLGSTLVILGTIRAALKERRLLADQVEELMEIINRRGGAESALHRREVANYLHSHVQNKLLAQALRIERSDHIDLDAEMEVLLTSLAPPALSETSEALDFNALVESWSGTVKITADCAEEPSKLVLASIEEAVTNAFRHGKASEVHVFLDENLLRITDNGLGPLNGKAGLGSLSFGQLGHWSLSPATHGGTELLIEFSDT